MQINGALQPNVVKTEFEKEIDVNNLMKKCRRLAALAMLLLSGGMISKLSAQKNPIVRNIYSADPSAHVWKDGRLYLYPSHDVAPPRGCESGR